MLVSAASENIYRLRSCGFSPNRVAILGANLLVFINLTGIFVTFFQPLCGNQKRAGEALVHEVFTGYAAWMVVVAFAFLYLFRFK